MNTLVFDIETVPDVEGGRKLYDLGDLEASGVAKAMFHLRAQKTGGSEFLAHHLQRIVAISVTFRGRGDEFKVWSLGDEKASEKDLIQRFFDGIERFTPTLVSWNGSGFDLPVIHYRAMLHKIAAPRYWDLGDDDSSFKWNNYISRYHQRHTDLMDVLALYGGRANAPLDELATLYGFPGKMGMDGSKVWEAFQAGKITEIRNYCETDVLNTWLVYLRFQLMRGQIDAERYASEGALVRKVLTQSGKTHLQAFAAAWEQGA
ncbi:3'-5' exonuclease [uncultured Thiothrix sp.]|uniref:3'-5' exonuclease n=1 Tax=uncultured Thiothrix sp. TaxID=223185 RepID=UPI00262EF017|nr:3'-5' exonuclease [uncultured Thiothrix sp.]HMT93254.1 3'-5' exonuclease [Thiolinea sp.]